MNKKYCRAAINRTVKKLDKKIPRWRRLIDKDYLDIGDAYSCVTAHVFGSYENGLAELDIDDPVYMGLALDIEPEDNCYSDEYTKLTELWKERI